MFYLWRTLSGGIIPKLTGIKFSRRLQISLAKTHTVSLTYLEEAPPNLHPDKILIYA